MSDGGNRNAQAQQPLDEPLVMRVDCTQFASCGWHGKRLVTKLGVQPKRCPRCGKETAA